MAAIAAFAFAGLSLASAALPADENETAGELTADVISSKKTFTVTIFNAWAMTIGTELGDKTFCIAALMAMRYNRAFVFAGAMGALFVMTGLSVAIGYAVPTLLPRQYTHYAAAILFFYFGAKLIKEAKEMSEAGTDAEKSSELKEAEEELGFSSSSSSSADNVGNNDNGASQPSEVVVIVSDKEEEKSSLIDPSGKSGKSAMGPRLAVISSAFAGGLSLKTLATVASALCLKDWIVFSQSFSLTFLAEWGDRSQIATIAMSASQDPFAVFVGAVFGHMLCTGLAVIGGRMLASRISEKTVAWVGGALFLLFGLHSIIAGPTADA